jgi:hypothetical protein
MKKHYGDDWKPIEECNVSDKEALAIYRYSLKNWHNILLGDDMHAISNQITKMLTADLEFRTINEAKRVNNEKERNQNEIIHRFIINGFVYPQYLRIRSLTELSASTGRRAVYSLPRIISEIEGNSDLITRENYVCYAIGSYVCKTDETDSYLEIRRLQKKFDALATKQGKERHKNDKIGQKFFANLRKKLELGEIHKLHKYVNKYLAHSADPKNRGTIDLFPFKDLDKIYKNICYVARELGEKILDCSREFLPFWQYDPLEFMSAPIATQGDIKHIREYWNLRMEQIRRLYIGETTDSLHEKDSEKQEPKNEIDKRRQQFFL